MKLIDKDTLVAEIDRRMQELRPTNTHKMQVGEKIDRDVLMWLNALTWVKNVINTLEAKEVDLKKEFDKCCENYIFDDEYDVYIARRFFELGMQVSNKAQKGE